MKIKKFTFNPFQENTYIIYDESKECMIIDPGCYSEEEREELHKFITEKELTPVKLINTHCHIDHVLGNRFVSEKWGLDLYINEFDMPLLEKSMEIAKMYALNEYRKSPSPKYFINEGDIIRFGSNHFNVLFTPGHSPGHICLYNKKHNTLISGDVIFQNSIGRTDLPGGNHEILITSIINKLFHLPESTQIFCGHGPATNLQYEKRNNPFLQ